MKKFAVVTVVMLSALPVALAATSAPERAAVATNVTLTVAQRQRIHIETVKPAAFRRTIETTAIVGFDNDQATTVLAPVSGPVSQLLVSLGAKVKPGDQVVANALELQNTVEQ